MKHWGVMEVAVVIFIVSFLTTCGGCIAGLTYKAFNGLYSELSGWFWDNVFPAAIGICTFAFIAILLKAVEGITND